ncbi:MAG: type II toxin-antitoxin system prevent-host-death family antitoxin [Propionibacteriaceae bacterium]|jgi:prevent-host-death family protein|nr:type II toxin-antitoxin system prevent-host-death family antitoxin [Propionibacteriaceae bacterium]
MSVAVISQRELRNASAAIMDRVERGESFTVTRNRRPVASLTPVNEKDAVNARRRFVPAAELASVFSPMPPGSFRSLRTDADEFFADEGDRAE